MRRMKKSVFCWEIDIQLNERNLCRGGLSFPGILLRKLEKEFLHNLDRTGNIPVLKFCPSICGCVVSDRPYRFCHGTDGGYDDGVSPAGGFRTVYRCLY